jgi:hypothetical protein
MDTFTELTEIAGRMPVMSGGGRGQRGKITMPDGTELQAGGSSRAHVLALLLNAARDWRQEHPETDPEPVVAPVPAPEAPVAGEATPGAPRARRQRPCDSSCLFANNGDCVCKCEGTNHMKGWALFAKLGIALGGGAKQPLAKVEAALDGPKRVKDGRVCACGCGGQTKGGRFIQGHDRKLHVALATVAEGSPFFKNDDEMGLVMTPLGRKALKEATA